MLYSAMTKLKHAFRQRWSDPGTRCCYDSLLAIVGARSRRSWTLSTSY
jgi:hypothetical protein